MWTPDQFNGLLTYVRNVLIVRIDKSQYTKVSLNYENNRWAKGQVVMTLTAPDDAAILEYVKAHPRNIVEFLPSAKETVRSDNWRRNIVRWLWIT